MKDIKLTEEELAMMNYNDIAHLILEKKNKKMKIQELFDDVAKVLQLDKSEYESHIGDFFELISTDKRFIMLEKGYWDLRVKHSTGIEELEEDNDDEEDETLLLDEEEEEEELDMYDTESTKAEDDDVEENDLADLVIIDEDDEENSL